MIIVTTENIPGKEIIEVKGTVIGSTIKTKHLGKDIVAAFFNLLGKDLKDYNDMMDEARKEAIEKMKSNAEDLGANAIICTRISPGSAIMGGAAEVFAYGTAVVVK